MQLVNRTPFLAERFVATDREVRDHVVVVVKATYTVASDGSTSLAAPPVPIHYADVHEGDPGITAVRYESDCAPTKPFVDVLLIGNAHAPGGRTARSVVVELQVGGLHKRLRVFGDRVWRGWGVFGYWKSAPRPFRTMPLSATRAFGGTDASHKKTERHVTDMRNPLGIGFHKRRSPRGIAGSPLPNLENPRRLIRSWRSKPDPVFLGCVPRGNAARIRYAGTYDQKWIDERFPFLPLDFETRYFQCAPEDQQLPELKGGERVRCVHVTPKGLWEFRVPTQDIPVTIFRRDGQERLEPRLDTMVLEPDEGRFSLVWRASAPVRGKLHDVLQVLVGELTAGERRAVAAGKPYFASVRSLSEWRSRRELEFGL